MGSTTSQLFGWLKPVDPPRIFVFGLDAAGKTSILYRLKLGKEIQAIPTIGFNVETISLPNYSVSIWDVGVRNAVSIVFVVDSADPERFSEAQEFLIDTLKDGCEDRPVLILANKQDLPNAVPFEQIAENLDLARILQNFYWTIRPCSVSQEESLVSGFQWLANILTRKRNKTIGKFLSEKAGNLSSKTPSQKLSTPPVATLRS
eukprot:gene1837-4935_t